MWKEDKYDSAIYYYSNALQIAKSINYTVRIAWSYQSLGFLTSFYHDEEGAIFYLKNAIPYFEAIQDSVKIAEITLYIGNFYQSLNLDSTLIYYEKTIELLNTIPNDANIIDLCYICVI